MEISYKKQGDYLIPNLIIETESNEDIGKYGLMKLNYIKKHNKSLYNDLLINQNLTKYLIKINERATSRIESHIKLLAEKNNVNEELKAKDQMTWVGLMNNFKNSAEEIVLKELIYEL